MKRVSVCVLLLAATSAFTQQSAPKRPKITGVDHVDFYTTAAEMNNHLDSGVLGLAVADPIEPGQTQRFIIGTQWVGYSPAPDSKATDRMDHVAFATDDCAALRSYLAANGVKVPDSIDQLKDGSRSFRVKDPEGHSIEFVERAKSEAKSQSSGDPVSRRMIHAGFIVRNHEAEDHFYKDILGFHLYWYGGMHPLTPTGLRCRYLMAPTGWNTC